MTIATSSLVPYAGQLTNFAVASVQHIAQLHHHCVAAHPADVAVVLRQHTRHLQARQRLLQVAVDVADCGRAGGRWAV